MTTTWALVLLLIAVVFGAGMFIGYMAKHSKQ